MKSRTSIKTRLLALVLTVLMTVGVLPFSVFALDGVATDDRLETDNTLFRAPTGDEIKEALGDDALLYYNNFNKQTGTIGNYGRPVGGVGIFKAPPADDNSLVSMIGGTIRPVDDGNGGKALQYDKGMNLVWHYNDGAANKQHPETSGKSFVFSVDYKLGTNTHPGDLIIIKSTVGSTAFSAHPVWVDESGNLYNGQIKQEQGLTGGSGTAITGGILWDGNPVQSYDITFNTADRKIGKLSADRFTNIAVAVDVEKNVYTIYIDGVAVAKDQTFACQNMLDYYETADMADGKKDYTNGFGMTAISTGWRDANNAAQKTDILIDNWLVYFADEYFNLFGSEYDSDLTADDFLDNDLTLFHYNDFNNQIITAEGQKAPSSYTSTLNIGANIGAFIRSGANEAIIDDGRDGKAFTYKKADSVPDNFQAYYQINGISGGGTATSYSGKSFVVSSDFKLSSATTIELLGACAANANTAEYDIDFKVQFVYTMEDGGIYIARKSDGDSTGVFVNDDTEAWKNNVQKIGYLSTSFFTNIAVAVNVEKNTMKVYINGVDATGELQFLTDSDKAIIESSANYSDGFGYSYTRINLQSSGYTTSDAPIIIDNVAAYLADDIVKPNNNPLNCYINDGGNYYYYNNGNIATNFTSADGILSAGLDGVVKYGVEPLANISSIYKYVGTDVIPHDGIFSGVYSYVKSANYYCYDASKNLIRNKTVYDAITEGIATDATKAVGFAIDGNGVATPLNGRFEVADGEFCFYVNGVRTKGMVEIGGNIFYITDDYTFFAGYQVFDGKTYFFDASDDNKGALVNGVHTVDTVDYKYYVEGVAQTGLISAADTKYFADENGVLLTGTQTDPESGNIYFFYADGPHKYKLAVGVSLIWNNTVIKTDANGIVDEVGGKVYGEWVKVDGKWYYSDASGRIATGLAYIENAPDGSEGGYYYLDENGMVKETFVDDIYGTTMYFHTDGKAYDGVVFVDADAVGFPADIILDAGAEGIYMHFVDGVFANGKTEVIQDGMKFTFNNGRISSFAELDENNPEILITIIKNGKKDSFYFNSGDNGEYKMLLTQYPCFTITVYDVTDKENPVQIAANAVIEGKPSGRYTLVGAHTYEIRYEAAEHVFGTTPVDTVEATCGADGYHVYKCTVDGCVATKKEAITERPDHAFTGTVTTLVAPECTKDGVGVTWCVNPECGASKTVTISATGVHVFENWIVEPSTCTTAGYKYSECKYEGCYEKSHEALPLADHVWGTYVVTTVANCVSGGVETATCINCTATLTRATAPDYDNHVHGINGTLTSDQDACIDYFELFQVVRVSTCLENGIATYRCKDCGGFVYNVELKLDPDNHHYNADEEYLAILDSEGNVIETVKIIDGQVYVDGVIVAAANSANDRRLEMLSYSKKICGYKAEWRIDCKNGCINPDDPTSDAENDDIVYYTVVEEVEHNYLHSFDLDNLYTTINEADPLYGYHFYKCQKCGRAAGVEAHEMTYTDNGDGTHNYHCKDNCAIENSGLPYGEFNITCDFETIYDDDYHWDKCIICGAEENKTSHTLTDVNDDLPYCSECSCGYKKAHVWTDVVAKDPTCDETGYTAHKTCSCGARSEEYEVIGTTAHVFTGAYESDSTGHWFECEECGFEYRHQDHNYVVVPAKAPTCEEDGYVAHRICADCEYLDGYSEIPATDHDVTGQPYNYDDQYHWQICKNCNIRITARHNLGAPLSDEEGTQKCGDCQHVVVDLSLTWWQPLGLERVTVEGHYYYTYNGTKNALEVIKGNYYYFDNDGYLVLEGDSGVNNANVKADNGTFDSITDMANSRGIISDAIIATANGTFYLINGEIQTSWQTIEGKDYYFNSTLNNALVNADAAEGALIKPADGETTIIALDKPESAKTLVNVDANGARLLGVVEIGGNAYYYTDGVAGPLTGRIEGRYDETGKLYFANADGVLYSGEWTSVNGVYYTFNADYSMNTRHANEYNETLDIYTDGEGKRIINGWYLAHGVGGRYIENGEMVVASSAFNYKIYGNTYYAFDADGVVSYYTGWNDGNTLYIASGIVVKSRFESIGGNNYYFDVDGNIVKAKSGETIYVVIGSWVYSIVETGVATQYTVGNSNPAVWVYYIVDGRVDYSAKGYYIEDGRISSRAFVIDTYTYIFDENGRCVTSKDNYECNGVVYVIDAEGKATVKDEDDE